MIISVRDFIDLCQAEDDRTRFDEAPEAVWFEIIKNHPEFKESVILNKTVPVSVIRVLSRDPDASVRFTVAMKRKCPLEVLEQLATDEDESVRIRVVYNAKTPVHVLELLMRDPSPAVREAVEARNKAFA